MAERNVTPNGGTAAADRGPAPTLAAPRRSLLDLIRLQEAGLVVVILFMGLLLTFGSDPVYMQGQTFNKFLRLENLVPLVATPASWIAIMAVGMTAVIIAGGIDLSVGAILALSALGTVAVLQGSPDEVRNAGPWVVLPLAFGTACGIGGLCGLFNGLLVVLLRIHPFIVTLGTLYFFRGLALVLVPSKTLPTVGNTMPDAYVDDFMAWQMPLGNSNSFIQPTPMLIMLGVVFVGWFYLQHTTMGRRIYAVGGNEEAARFSGVAVWRVKLGVYVISGITAGLAGAVMAGFNGSANTATGNMYELIVIASAVVGGASLVGGRGTALGALLGTIVIMLIDNGIFVLDWNKEYAKAITGIAIIIAVAVDRFSRYLSDRRLASARGRARLA